MTLRTAAVVLAAGKSTRMKSKTPKGLHPLCGKRLLDYVLDACQDSGAQSTVVVVGHQAEAVKEALGDRARYALQENPMGTGHALQMAEGALPEDLDTVLVIPGDTPLLTSEDLRALLRTHEAEGNDATVLTTVLDDASHYGRVVRDAEGAVLRIVEAKDATPEEKRIGEINSSVYCFDRAKVFAALRKLDPKNAQKELYLTDAIEILNREGSRVGAVVLRDSMRVLGVNNRVELADAEAELRRRKNERLMLDGVSLMDPLSTYVDWDVEVGADTILLPNTLLLKGTVIGEDCRIGPNVQLTNMVVADGVTMTYAVGRDSEVAAGASVGPFAQIRPKSKIGPKVKIGNFVEVNRSQLGAGVKASHLTYLGDAEVGEGTNIGAGTITCNYDGKHKHKTRIGKDAFIGSHSTLIAPVEVGDGAYVAAASPITQNVPGDSLAVARCRQTVKEGWARRKREAQKG
ncbi:MAG TPA: bifunctional UDP-N-acetylglucosamine diphosphorylase/glucosamine-1-phosphate N-acetyltransferase GlmU [Armatimonadota bacterium]